VAKKSKLSEHAPRDQHKKRPGRQKKSLNKAEKRQKKKTRYKGQGKG
jgi:hypothetical protein